MYIYPLPNMIVNCMYFRRVLIIIKKTKTIETSKFNQTNKKAQGQWVGLGL